MKARLNYVAKHRSAALTHSHMPDLQNRRQFFRNTVIGSLGIAAATSGCASVGGSGRGDPKVAFVTANFVARVSGYRFELARWGDQHKKTIAATDSKAWEGICRDIADAGFQAIEIWEAHAAPEAMNRERAATWKAIMADHGLKPIGYGGSFNQKTVEICQWLGVGQINGGKGDLSPEQATDLCRASGVRFNLENHPQKSAQEVLAIIGGGNEWLGMCVDTGWFGTQGVSSPDIIRACGPLVRHVHVKDVEAVGGHLTCLLGDGVAQVAESLQALKSINYSGWYSWEDEPEHRNPLDSAVRNRRWIEKRIA